ncbi:MAG TPA: Eco57I restriction-modification methylase domain-containing protein, partial [Polyangiaceae bacterium]|nr:Eco57I restriction-modification methylase domain-containing protein [Polyangiaceae bacterium]
MTTTTVQQAEAAHEPLFATAYLRSLWGEDYARFRGSEAEAQLLERLRAWAAKQRQMETVAEAGFVDVFFKQTWGYRASGQGAPGEGYSLHPQYPVKSAGERGRTGKADLALGYFGRDDLEPVPQVLGELKDDRSGLDKEQSRSNRRSPVDQCFDYLREARSGRVSKLLPTWAFVSDMNEFRLYIYGNKAQYQRFVIEPSAGDPAIPLLADSEESAFQRFVFSRVFHTDWLLSTAGKSPLEKLLGEQLMRERALEADFYKEFQAYRERLFAVLRDHNPQFAEQGRLRRLVGLTQRLLDRFIFVLYCEDMGRQLSFPPNVLRDVLIEVAGSRFYNPGGSQAWDQLRALFSAMRDGGPFGADRIHKFNGGLFADEPELEALRVPNEVFCTKDQGESPERLLGAPLTLLFLASKYNFGAADDGAGRTLTLTAMGRIFEQSITDLEFMDARAAGRDSLTEITKRKRDGVYYTPEWITKYVVEQTVGERLAEIRAELGFERLGVITDAQVAESRKDARRAPAVKEYVRALHAYSERLDLLKIVDPACGSGAFLIQVFQYLYAQRQWVAAELERVTGTRSLFDTHEAMRAVLAHNLYGVDINAESVELTRLALWLHTALPDRPLTSLDRNIRCGNSLVGPDFAAQLGLDPVTVSTERLERVNPFDWRAAFPEVFDRPDAGFDCVVGNPPYVKLQNFRRVLEDVALYLVQAKKADGSPRYESTQTGNFDLYLPFIERGVELLGPKGKLGYIAPSLWLVNEYGEGLRRFVKRTRSLDRWIDFKAHQVFDEAMTYTALQFYSGSVSREARCVFAPRGAQDLRAAPWDNPQARIDVGSLDPAVAWELVTDNEASLIRRLRADCPTLEDVAGRIFQGVITSADSIYHLTRVGPGKYLRWPGAGADPVEVEIEDELMRPLISGTEARRFHRPATDTFLLFPYRATAERTELRAADDLRARTPKAWAYLQSFEALLRAREGGKFDDDQWYRFGRNQNIDKQHLPKLMVP